LALLASLVLASWEQQASLYYQYFAQAIPFLIAGSVAYFKTHEESKARLSMVATALVFVLLGPVFYLGFGLPDRFASVIATSGHRSQAREMLASLPPNATVSATEMVSAAVAWRAEIHPFPGPMVCGNSLGYYTSQTKVADYVVYEPDTAPAGPDWMRVLPMWGYVRVDESAGIQLWKLVSDQHVAERCPSWEEQKAASREQ
jgi:hypothetical protein